jgi:hypothetical protein
MRVKTWTNLHHVSYEILPGYGLYVKGTLIVAAKDAYLSEPRPTTATIGTVAHGVLGEETACLR